MSGGDVKHTKGRERRYETETVRTKTISTMPIADNYANTYDINFWLFLHA
jgi:hypothetical protein